MSQVDWGPEENKLFSRRWKIRWARESADLTRQHLYWVDSVWREVHVIETPTLEHILDENGALDDILISGELLIVRGDEKDHCGLEKVGTDKCGVRIE